MVSPNSNSSRLHDKHIWALTPKALSLYNYLREAHGLDSDIAFEVVEKHLGEEETYILGEDGERRPSESGS